MAASDMSAEKGGGFITKYSDVLVAVGIVTIVVMMIIPLPTMLLDLLLCMNITLALVVVMAAIYNVEALDLSVFPSLLLITTLFRLALNVSSTRLILLEGYAGEVIMSFGNFVVGGNAVVGFIIFIILIIIQFIVITKGAERVAEVSARFTLDAMPGKQMSIDADLNQGAITDA
ncbi:MAG: FHIPEP family type III secretion protein, partial [Anaerovibrio sp.]|nr:FHIPEP family type III secretion protein [Anaerovibrio sp.]